MAQLTELPELARTLADAALSGGRAIMSVYRSDFSVCQKPDKTPVCDADTLSESAILEQLETAFPDIPVAAEESFANGHNPACGSQFFLVDPLDGTKEFVQRNGEFTVNIALIEDSRPIAGIVLAPALEKIWLAADGHAWAGRADAPLTSINACIAASTRKSRVPPVAVASRSHLTAETGEILKRACVKDCRSIGSSLKFCLLADAEADFYPRIGPTMEWDTAAGHAILTAAGGHVVTMDGNDLTYGHSPQARHNTFENPSFLAVGDRDILPNILDQSAS